MGQANEVECTIPVVPVASLDRSIQFYTQQLGFAVDWRSGTVCSVSRDGSPIMLLQSDSPKGVWGWVGLETDALFDEFRARGVPVLQEPKNFSWPYAMKFADPDGNVLWLGTESRADMPLEDRPPN